MFLLRSLLLAAMALPRVMAQDDSGVKLKECVGGEFEESYFNFDIQIDSFSEDCEDFEKMGERIQLMVEEIQVMIPEFEEEWINAMVCPFPTYVGQGRRHLRLRKVKAKKGKYSFVGAGGCKRCKKEKLSYRYLAATDEKQYGHEDHDVSTDRELKQNDEDGASFEERVCEILVGEAVVDAAVAERAVERAEQKLNEIMATIEKSETKELLDGGHIEKFVDEAKKECEECKKAAGLAKARVLFVRKACESEDFSSEVVTPEDQQGFEEVAMDSEKEIQKDTNEAQKDFYKVKEENIGLKTEIVKSKFSEMEFTFKETADKLDSELREECDKLKVEAKNIGNKIKVAQKKGDKALEEELKMELEILNEKSTALQDEVNSFKETEPKRIEKDFEFAMGIIEMEAANTFEDYMKAFVDLMKKALQGSLHLKFKTCFEKAPKVEVEVDKLMDKNDQITLRSCPKGDK